MNYCRKFLKFLIDACTHCLFEHAPIVGRENTVGYCRSHFDLRRFFLCLAILSRVDNSQCIDLIARRLRILEVSFLNSRCAVPITVKYRNPKVSTLTSEKYSAHGEAESSLSNLHLVTAKPERSSTPSVSAEIGCRLPIRY